jgi:hypothetical protein
MSTFEDTFKEVQQQKSAAAGEAPSPEETTEPSQPAPTVEPTSDNAQEAVVETKTDEGASVEEKVDETKPTTEDETPFNLTGLETPEDLQQRHGDTWMSKTARKYLAMVKEAGGSPALRHGVEIAKATLNPESTGDQIADAIYAASQEQYGKVRSTMFFEVLKAYPDFAVQKLFEDPAIKEKLGDTPLTLDFVKTAVANELQYANPNTEAEADPSDLSQLPEALRREIEESREMRKKFPQLEKELSGFREERKTEAQQKRERQENDLGVELKDSVFSVVEERKKDLGLDITQTDTPRVAGIKRAILNHLSEEKIDRAFMASEINANLSKLAIAEVRKLSRDNAFAYRNDLARGLEITFQDMLKSPEISSLLEALKSEMESQSTPRNPTARTEIVQGAPAGMTTTDPFDEGAKAGKSPFDVSVEMAGRGQAATTR